MHYQLTTIERYARTYASIDRRMGKEDVDTYMQWNY